ncbi:hypothetical protein GCM10023085_38520 [Actinomadura viridis]|uniref:Guanylate cyclase domain-containing protein n=1 Tax=Actinomadura viridis TaxID=58110 RepID=A0A931DUC6_9ACTN|nr:hypothetical protein [Actinomadura viridis]MBG6092858.1 hypothetical protein [Actinomadura viridis]
MPSMQSLLVVDTKGFSGHPDAVLPILHTEMRDALSQACEHSGLGEAWKAARFQQSTGDGVLALLPLDAMEQLIHPFPIRLQEALATAARRLRADGARLRLRVALHVGRVDDEHPVTAGISTSTVDVNRLLDCKPLRAALDESHPDVTFTAVIVSSEAFKMFVEGGHTGLHPSQLRPVRAEVKQFDQPAYLYVPTPSWREHPPTSEPTTLPAPSPAPPSGGGISMGNVEIPGQRSQNSFGNQVGGDYRQERS